MSISVQTDLCYPRPEIILYLHASGILLERLADTPSLLFLRLGQACGMDAHMSRFLQYPHGCFDRLLTGCWTGFMLRGHSILL